MAVKGRARTVMVLCDRLNVLAPARCCLPIMRGSVRVSNVVKVLLGRGCEVAFCGVWMLQVYVVERHVVANVALASISFVLIGFFLLSTAITLYAIARLSKRMNGVH